LARESEKEKIEGERKEKKGKPVPWREEGRENLCSSIDSGRSGTWVPKKRGAVVPRGKKKGSNPLEKSLEGVSSRRKGKEGGVLYFFMTEKRREERGPRRYSKKVDMRKSLQRGKRKKSIFLAGRRGEKKEKGKKFFSPFLEKEKKKGQSRKITVVRRGGRGRRFAPSEKGRGGR